jgi:hypothetical protein
MARWRIIAPHPLRRKLHFCGGASPSAGTLCPLYQGSKPRANLVAKILSNNPKNPVLRTLTLDRTRSAISSWGITEIKLGRMKSSWDLATREAV